MTDTNELTYPAEKKKRLASKISRMRNKNNLKCIRKILFDENPELDVSKNKTGQLMFFQNCTYETYIKLEKFITLLEEKKLSKSMKESDSIRQTLSSEMDDTTVTDYTTSRTRLRYSNHEKKLIRRKKYEKIISEKLVSDSNDNNTKNNKSIFSKA